MFTTMHTQEEIKNYRQAVVAELMAHADKEGLPSLTEEQALALSLNLTDEALEEGMDFNTPEEVAALLLEVFG